MYFSSVQVWTAYENTENEQEELKRLICQQIHCYSPRLNKRLWDQSCKGGNWHSLGLLLFAEGYTFQKLHLDQFLC